MEKLSHQEDDECLTQVSRSEDESDALLDEFILHDLRRRWTSQKRVAIITFIVISCIAVYTAFIILIATKAVDHQCRGGPAFIPNIAQDAVKFEEAYFEDYHKPDHPYFGEPTKALDQNWMRLMKWSDVRVPDEEMRRLGREYQGVHFPDGGYFGMMTVHHHLHCLMRMHHHNYLEHYFPNMTERERILERKHTIHCFDLIKQAIMCQGDTTLLTMRWTDMGAIPQANWSTPHSCTDWSLIDGWARNNWVDVRQEGWMVHPDFGPVFVDGKNNGSRIGVVSGVD